MSAAATVMRMDSTAREPGWRPDLADLARNGGNVTFRGLWFGIAMLAGVSFAQAQEAQYHPPLSAELVGRAQARLDSRAGADERD